MSREDRRPPLEDDPWLAAEDEAVKALAREEALAAGQAHFLYVRQPDGSLDVHITELRKPVRVWVNDVLLVPFEPPRWLQRLRRWFR